MNNYLEIFLFKLYYKIPFFSYQQKRKFILFFHHYLKFLTKHTISYQIYQVTAIQNHHHRGFNYFIGNYSKWIKKYDSISKEEHQYLQGIMENWSSKPLISIIMIIQSPEESSLRTTIESVMAQSYSKWELHITSNITIQPHLYKILRAYAIEEPRIKLTIKDTTTSIITFNQILEIILGDFSTFINQEDQFSPHTLFWIASDILEHPEGMFWYSDEDKIDKNGKRKDPHFKPDWNPDLFLSYPYNFANRVGVYRTSLIRQLKGFQQKHINIQEYDLTLRIIEQIKPSQIRHIPRILYHSSDTTNIIPNPCKAIPLLQVTIDLVNDHLHRKKVRAQATLSPDNLYIRVRYELPEKLPLVSLIIPTFNGFKILRQCIESIIMKTSYPNYEIIIINNNSDDQKTLQYLQSLKESPKIKVLDYPHSFNYSAINNMAVNYANGKIIGFLNNDIEVINEDWLTEMVSHALRPEIGAVGARLWYKDNTLQHGGVILGVGGVANHSHKGISKGDPGYFGRAILVQNFSAVTGACMILRKDCFIAVGGFNERQLAVTFNDVDLCLKIIRSGLRIVWTPYAELYHHESASRGYDDTVEKLTRSQKEIAYMQKHWKKWLIFDPAYNPNLTLETEDFALAWPPRIGKYV